MANKKINLSGKTVAVLIPVIIAIAVVVALAISGRVSQTRDTSAQTVTASKLAEVEKTEPTTVSENAKVTLVAVGDNLIHNTLIDAYSGNSTNRDYSAFYENIKPYIQGADIAVINQETMLGGSSFEYAGYPCFNTPWEVADAARNAGFDVFTCATNHSLDVKKYSGIEKECEYFANHTDVVHTGTNATEEDANTITYYEKNGITFALLNYTEMTNGISLPEDKKWCVNMLTKERVTKDVKEARANADVVMVFPHWGTENSNQVNDMQRDYVSLFSSLEVDIVIGTHPHVLQPVEWVTNEKTGKKTLVYYSVGNFISHQINLNQLVGGMAEITVERVNGKISITSAKLAPVVTYYKSTGSGYKFSVYRLNDYNDDLASSQAQSGLTVGYATDLAKDVISEEFLDLQ